MRIAIDLRSKYNNHTALSIFTQELWEDLARLNTTHSYIFFAGGDAPATQPHGNMSVQPLTQTGISWLDKINLQKALKVLPTDRFVHLHKTGFFIEHTNGKKQALKIILGADDAPAAGDNGKTQPKNKSFNAVAIGIQPVCRDVITALTWTQAESIKTQYTGDRSFFLFTGDITEQHQLVELLKAFSVFKKWQQSNMQLVIAGNSSAWTQVLEEKLLTYKYKADVVILKNISGLETARLAAASYAMLYPAKDDGFSFGLLLALQSGKAVIASDSVVNRQLVPAAEWVDKTNTAEGFAKAMILLYKDEKHGQELVRKNSEAAQQLNRSSMLNAVWQCVEK